MILQTRKPRSLRRGPLAALLLVGGLWAGGHAAAQQAAPQTPADPAQDAAQDTGPTLIARELLVLQADRYSELANDPSQLRSTLGKTFTQYRARVKKIDETGGYLNRPMPLGLITFEGRVEQPLRIKIGLPDAAAQVHAHWPKGITGQHRIDWQALDTAEAEQRAQPFGSGDQWLATLREADDRLWLGSEHDPLRRKERFFLYDASLPFDPGLTLSADGKAYRLSTAEKTDPTPPLAILVHRLTDGWAAQTRTEPWEDNAVGFDFKPSSDTAGSRLDALLAPLAKVLTERGYNAAEVALALEMIAGAGLDRSEMSLVYLLPEGAIDGLVELDIQPRPDEVVRTAIVVLNNIDPDLGVRVRMLIAQLGSETWRDRAEAQQLLETLGKAAVKQLQNAREHSDPEVAFRAQQILDAYDLAQERNH